jgi:hypothetical protein
VPEQKMRIATNNCDDPVDEENSPVANLMRK